MSTTNGLSDTKQAILVFIALAIPAIGAWAALGFPTDKLALGALVAAILTGMVLAIKELMGTTPAAPAATTPTKLTIIHLLCKPLAVFRIQRRLMFLQRRK